MRFDRIIPAPFSIDTGGSSSLVLDADGGDDSSSATGNLAALVKITIDGGIGNDNLIGSNGVDTIIGGDGNDFVDGQQGNDTAFLSAGDDSFQWDPDLTEVNSNQAAPGGADDGVTDEVVANATQGSDVISLSGRDRDAQVSGLPARVTVTGASAGVDRLTVNALNGDDVEIESPTIAVRAAGGNGQEWIAAHAATVDGKTVLNLGSRTVNLRRRRCLSRLEREVGFGSSDAPAGGACKVGSSGPSAHRDRPDR